MHHSHNSTDLRTITTGFRICLSPPQDRRWTDFNTKRKREGKTCHEFCPSTYFARARRTASKISVCPAGPGCNPSGRYSSGSGASPNSSIKSTSGKPCWLARSRKNISLGLKVGIAPTHPPRLEIGIAVDDIFDDGCWLPGHRTACNR